MPDLSPQSLYQAVFSTLVVVIPAVLAWHARNYLKSANSRRQVGVIADLADAAINYAEDVDRRGEREQLYNSLDLPDDMAGELSPGRQKLYLASSWLADELRRMGIGRIGLEEAAKWVAAEYQEKVGDLHSAKSIAQLTDRAADLLNQLGRAGHVTLPKSPLDAASMLQAITDWAAKQVEDAGSDRTLQRELAMARISPRTLMATSANSRSGSRISTEVRLAMLAQRAAEYAAELKKGKSSTTLPFPEKDIAKAWLVQHFQEDDLAVTPEQVDKALTDALEQRIS
jgi:hypothetical protein